MYLSIYGHYTEFETAISQVPEGKFCTKKPLVIEKIVISSFLFQIVIVYFESYPPRGHWVDSDSETSQTEDDIDTVFVQFDYTPERQNHQPCRKPRPTLPPSPDKLKNLAHPPRLWHHPASFYRGGCATVAYVFKTDQTITSPGGEVTSP